MLCFVIRWCSCLGCIRRRREEEEELIPGTTSDDDEEFQKTVNTDIARLSSGTPTNYWEEPQPTRNPEISSLSSGSPTNDREGPQTTRNSEICRLSPGPSTNVSEELQPTRNPEISSLSPGKERLRSTRATGESSAPKDRIDAHVSTRSPIFTLQELTDMTHNFTSEYLPGKDEFGRVYMANLGNQVVTITRLNRSGFVRKTLFIEEVSKLRNLHHPNIINLIGYCVESSERLLVHESPPMGTLEEQLHSLPHREEPIQWKTRMKIAAGVARGLQYLHEDAHIVYQDFKPSNILLDKTYQPKLSLIGFANIAVVKGGMSSVRRNGSYSANEYVLKGNMMMKPDIYSFGVVLLELVAGRTVIDLSKEDKDKARNLVLWARQVMEHHWRYEDLVDPRLQHRYPENEAKEAIGLGLMCAQDDVAKRPDIQAIVNTMSKLESL